MNTAEAGALAIVLKDAGPAAVDMVKRILGPMCDELGQLGGEWVMTYRISRIASALGKTVKQLKATGINPKTVRPGLLFPILEGASWEDDENLHDKWANLLANAAKGDDEETVHVGFIEVLKQLSPQDALFLDNLYRGSNQGRSLGDMQSMTIVGIGGFPRDETELLQINTILMNDQEKIKCDLTIDNLLRLRIIETNTQGDEFFKSAFQGAKQGYWFTTFGLMFLEACTRPRAVKNKAEQSRTTDSQAP